MTPNYGLLRNLPQPQPVSSALAGYQTLEKIKSMHSDNLMKQKMLGMQQQNLQLQGMKTLAALHQMQVGKTLPQEALWKEFQQSYAQNPRSAHTQYLSSVLQKQMSSGKGISYTSPGGATLQIGGTQPAGAPQPQTAIAQAPQQQMQQPMQQQMQQPMQQPMQQQIPQIVQGMQPGMQQPPQQLPQQLPQQGMQHIGRGSNLLTDITQAHQQGMQQPPQHPMQPPPPSMNQLLFPPGQPQLTPGQKQYQIEEAKANTTYKTSIINDAGQQQQIKDDVNNIQASLYRGHSGIIGQAGNFFSKEGAPLRKQINQLVLDRFNTMQHIGRGSNLLINIIKGSKPSLWMPKASIQQVLDIVYGISNRAVEHERFMHFLGSQGVHDRGAVSNLWNRYDDAYRIADPRTGKVNFDNQNKWADFLVKNANTIQGLTPQQRKQFAQNSSQMIGVEHQFNRETKMLGTPYSLPELKAMANKYRGNVSLTNALTQLISNVRKKFGSQEVPGV